jgi:hypothetical protein
MSSIIFGGDVTYKGQTFPRLTMKHYSELEQSLRDYRRSAIKATLDQQHALSPADKAQQLALFESKPITWLDVDDWLMTADGATRVLCHLRRPTRER